MIPQLSNDPQSSKDTRGIALDYVGIENFELPVCIEDWSSADGGQALNASISVGVSVKAEQRGIHMSRLVEELGGYADGISLAKLPKIVSEVANRQAAYRSEIEINFRGFVERAAPATGKISWLPIPTCYVATINESDHRGTVGYRIEVPVTSLCPCSREISDYGAHNQRSWIIAEFRWETEGLSAPEILAPLEAIALLETCASAPIYPLLKRPDERHVTMQAFENPAFVEDIARASAKALRQEARVSSFTLRVRNEESIHTHNAIARFEHNW